MVRHKACETSLAVSQEEKEVLLVTATDGRTYEPEDRIPETDFTTRRAPYTYVRGLLLLVVGSHVSEMYVVQERESESRVEEKLKRKGIHKASMTRFVFSVRPERKNERKKERKKERRKERILCLRACV